MIESIPAASRRTAAGSAQRLMDAAVDAFADKGFHATSTRDIAARAQMSPAGVYVHFASKQDLLFQLCRRGHLLALEVVESARESADTPADQLVSIVSAFASWHAEQFRTARIVQYEFPHLSPGHRAEVMTLRKQIDAVVRDVLQEGVATGDFDVPDPAMTTLALQSLTIDVARWYKPGIRRTPEAIGAAYGALALRMVRA
ncbi:MAG TPA: TetR/AcrR family transcriptional regulator [Dermatophilaceae bacterium]|nr:TetR/AcrR family transcriptional regulator [Dermatophilaceae bacterium]